MTHQIFLLACDWSKYVTEIYTEAKTQRSKFHLSYALGKLDNFQTNICIADGSFNIFFNNRAQHILKILLISKLCHTFNTLLVLFTLFQVKNFLIMVFHDS